MTTDPAASEARQNGLVVLAGAGVSMGPPASLPGWFELNRMVLDALKNRVADYGDRTEPFEDLLRELIDRRDKQRVFPPEYQAQVMEEQIGLTYFRALQALDVSQRNGAHEAVAALAKAGAVRAIVTTNFDRLIEAALREHGVEHQVLREPAEFRALADDLGRGEVGALPVVKIHGSVESVESLVDTLRQRLRGRGPALEAALRPLLRRYYWVYCGFSGADLDFDPNYLGLRAAAADSPGFTFVHLPGDAPRPSVAALGEAYNGKASFVGAPLDDWFAGVADAVGVSLPPPPPKVADARAEIAAALADWAAALHPMEAVNTFSALLEAGGHEPAALWLLRKTWKWFRRPEDTSGPAYARFLLNYGRLALAAADEQDGETIQQFLRTRDEIPESAMYAGLYFAYAGDNGTALALLREAQARMEADGSPGLKADFALGLADYSRAFGQFDSVLEAIQRALPVVAEDGDLPRRGRLLAAAANIWANSGALDEATKAIEEAGPIATRIGHDVLAAEVGLARGCVDVAAGDYDAGRGHLREAAEVFAAYGRTPLFLDAAFALIHAASLAGDIDEGWEVYEAARGERVVGFAPRLSLTIGEYYALAGQPADAERNFEEARARAEEHGNGWMRGAAERALEQLRGG